MRKHFSDRPRDHAINTACCAKRLYHKTNAGPSDEVNAALPGRPCSLNHLSIWQAGATRRLPVGPYDGPMWQFRIPLGQRAEVLALNSHVKRAGLALACPFSSSAEFEAAIINSKRRAGMYGPRRQYRYAVCFGATAGAIATAAFLMI